MEAVSKMARRAFPRAAPVGPAATDIREALHAAGSRSDPRCCLDCPNVLLQVNASSLMAYTYRQRVSRRLPQVTQHSNPCTDPLPFTLRLEFGTIKDHMHSLSAPTRAGIDYCALENAFERKGAKWLLSGHGPAHAWLRGLSLGGSSTACGLQSGMQSTGACRLVDCS